MGRGVQSHIQLHVLADQVLDEGGLAGPGLTDGVYMVTAIRCSDAEYFSHLSKLNLAKTMEGADTATIRRIRWLRRCGNKPKRAPLRAS